MREKTGTMIKEGREKKQEKRSTVVNSFVRYCCCWKEIFSILCNKCFMVWPRLADMHVCPSEMDHFSCISDWQDFILRHSTEHVNICVILLLHFKPINANARETFYGYFYCCILVLCISVVVSLLLLFVFTI